MKFFQNNRKAILGVAACLAIGTLTLSFQDSPFNSISPYEQQAPKTDTIPDKKWGDGDKMTMKEFERLPEKIDKEVARAMEEIKKVDWSAIEKQVHDALKNVDMEKIQLEVQKAMKEVDMGKLSAELNKSLAELKDVNWGKIESEIKSAMDEVKRELQNINMDEMKKELDNAKIEIEKSKKEFEKIDLGKIMEEAKEGIAEAKEELQNIKLMFDEMEKDGLINKKKGFSVEYKDKSLYIDGQKQSDKVTEKYRHYFKNDHFKITIDNSKEVDI